MPPSSRPGDKVTGHLVKEGAPLEMPPFKRQGADSRKLSGEPVYGPLSASSYRSFSPPTAGNLSWSSPKRVRLADSRESQPGSMTWSCCLCHIRPPSGSVTRLLAADLTLLIYVSEHAILFFLSFPVKFGDAGDFLTLLVAR